MLQLDMLLQRPLRPVRPAAKLGLAVVFPFDLLSSPPRPLATSLIRLLIGHLDLLLDPPGLVQGCKLCLSLWKGYFDGVDLESEGILDLGLLALFGPEAVGCEVYLLELVVVFMLDVGFYMGLLDV